MSRSLPLLFTAALFFITCSNSHRIIIPPRHTAAECAEEWSRAREWVLANANAGIRRDTGNRVTTFNPGRHADVLSADIRKVNVANGVFKIQMSLRCDNPRGCNMDKQEAQFRLAAYASGDATRF
jgi:hypothetical protein